MRRILQLLFVLVLLGQGSRLALAQQGCVVSGNTCVGDGTRNCIPFGTCKLYPGSTKVCFCANPGNNLCVLSQGTCNNVSCLGRCIGADCDCYVPNPGSMTGEPHVRTFDGLVYDFQGVGEYVLSKEPRMTVQVRLTPLKGAPISVQTAVAISSDCDRVGIHLICPSERNPSAAEEEPSAGEESAGSSDGASTSRHALVVLPTEPSKEAGTHGIVCSPELRVNGVQTTIASGSSLSLTCGGEVRRVGAVYMVTTVDSSSTTEVRIESRFLNVRVSLHDLIAHVGGMLGNADGNPHNDIVLRNGTALIEPITFRDLYDSYGESWRVMPSESLFDYLPGESTGTFVDRSFPPFQMSLSYIPLRKRRAAEKICRNAGIIETYSLDSCMLDVALTGDPDFAESFAGMSISAVASMEVVQDPAATARGEAWAAAEATAFGSGPHAPADRSSTCACSTPGSRQYNPRLFLMVVSLGVVPGVRRRRRRDAHEVVPAATSGAS